MAASPFPFSPPYILPSPEISALEIFVSGRRFMSLSLVRDHTRTELSAHPVATSLLSMEKDTHVILQGTRRG